MTEQKNKGCKLSDSEIKIRTKIDKKAIKKFFKKRRQLSKASIGGERWILKW